MLQRNYEIILTGATDLLMHQDNLTMGEYFKSWLKEPNNKKNSTPGDDRSPAFTWLGYAYSHAGVFCIPSDNLMTMLREGGGKCPTGKRQETFKRHTQSGLLVNEIGWPLLINGGTVPWAPFEAMLENNNYAEHEALAKSYGFELFAKRAKIGAAKHVRVRPRFRDWSAVGTITVFEDLITTEALQNILTHAGTYCGLGDWRPSSPKSPGSFGRFTAQVRLLK